VSGLTKTINERLKELYVASNHSEDDSDIQVPTFSFDVGKYNKLKI
jgi:hypothetical protein